MVAAQLSLKLLSPDCCARASLSMPPKRPYSATGDDHVASVGASSVAPITPSAPVVTSAALAAGGSPVIVLPSSSIDAPDAAAAVEAPVAAPAAAIVLPASPGRNRAMFLATVTPQLMSCDLTHAVVGQGVKHNLVAVVVASFPVQNGPPARRHIICSDAHGTTGITIWNTDVHKFPKDVLGGVVSITRASVSIYQGKKSLVLNRESTVSVSTTTPSPMAEWWAGLARQPPLPLPAALIAADNSVICVFGVLAFISHETKEVNGVERRVTSVHLASQTARFQLRGWDLLPATVTLLESLAESVVQVKRVRITCFAELKIGEILDSPLGTVLAAYNDVELAGHWAE